MPWLIIYSDHPLTNSPSPIRSDETSSVYGSLACVHSSLIITQQMNCSNAELQQGSQSSLLNLLGQEQPQSSQRWNSNSSDKQGVWSWRFWTGFFPSHVTVDCNQDACCWTHCDPLCFSLLQCAFLLFGNLFQFSFTSAWPGSPRLPSDSSLWNLGVLLLCSYPGWQEGY